VWPPSELKLDWTRQARGPLTPSERFTETLPVAAADGRAADLPQPAAVLVQSRGDWSLGRHSGLSSLVSAVYLAPADARSIGFADRFGLRDESLRDAELFAFTRPVGGWLAAHRGVSSQGSGPPAAKLDAPATLAAAADELFAHNGEDLWSDTRTMASWFSAPQPTFSWMLPRADCGIYRVAPEETKPGVDPTVGVVGAARVRFVVVRRQTKPGLGQGGKRARWRREGGSQCEG